MYQALYRKWRPRTFDDVAGQRHVTETLKHQITADRLSHAYLFVGTRGTGKTSCAKIFARAVNCENPQNGNPCNKCKSCVGIEDGSILDVVELDAASNNGVENVRALRDEAVYSPAVVKKRVYIIDEVHMLSTSAFNALLKILEEPPEHLLFILATTELNKVPATILSRCQRHSFKRITPADMSERLSYVALQENLQLDDNAADLLSRLADGSLRDGLSLLDQCSANEHITVDAVLSAMGLAGNLRTIELLTEVSRGNTQNSLSLFGEMWRDGKAPATLLTELCGLLRDILMIKIAPNGGALLLSGGFDLDTLRRFAKELTAEQLISGIDSIQARVGALRDGRDPKTAAELCIIGLCEPDLGDDITHLRERIAILERKLENGSFISAKAPEAQSSTNIKPEKSEKSSSDSADDEPPFELYEDAPTEDSRDEYYERPPFEPDELEAPPEPNEYEAPAASPPREEPVMPPPSKQAEMPAAAPSVQCDEDWKQIQAELKSTMPIFLFIHLSDATGEIRDGTLHIYVTSAFHQTGLEQTVPQDQIRSAIQKVLGKTLPFKISVNKGGQGSAAASLSDLSKFGNVKFE